jgi:hypothetical protein
VVDIAGKDLEDTKELRFDHPGITAEFVKENQFRVTIAEGTPVGIYEVRAVGRNGISASKLFSVSRGLTEIREGEPNDSPQESMAVPLNVAIHGDSDESNVDCYRFAAEAGQRVVVECQAIRLDSEMRGAITLFSSEGKELATGRPVYGRTDPILDFVIPAGGEYFVEVHDATYTGGRPYRLVISDLPVVDSVFPPTVRPGESAQVTVLGRNFPGARPQPRMSTASPPLETLTVPVSISAGATSSTRFVMLEPLGSPSRNTRGVQLRPPGLDSALSPLTLAVVSEAPRIENEPNDSAEHAQKLELPAVICGRFDRPGDADWFEITAKANEPISVDLLCERIGTAGDPRVVVLDDKSNEVASLDDHGADMRALAQSNRDPLGTFTPPADGAYRLVVEETYRRGGPRFTYVLRVAKPEPDFYPVAFHETPVDPSCPVVRKGGSAFYEVWLNRRDGFDKPVTVEATGLPPGVSCPPAYLSPQADWGVIVFTAAADAADWAGPIRLRARAKINEAAVEREVECVVRRWPTGNVNTCRASRELCLAVRPGAPYNLRLPTDPLTITAGASGETKVVAQRLQPEFKDKIQVIGLNLFPGFEVPAVEIPADKTEVAVKINVGSDVPPGKYTVVLRGDAQVPFSPDPNATEKPLVRVADPSTPLTVVVTAPVQQ